MSGADPLFTQIETTGKELINRIREYGRSQKNFWQQIPYLALQADGRYGYNDQYSRAYTQGYWAIRASCVSGYSNVYDVYVDLENGELVSAHDPRKPARDEALLALVFQMSKLDAALFVRALFINSRKSTASGYNCDKQRRWRAEIQREYDLRQNSYKRSTAVDIIARRNAVAGLVD